MAPQLLRTAESRTSGFRCTSALPVICLHVVGRPGNPQSIAPHHHIRTCGNRTRVLSASCLICRLAWAAGHTNETLLPWC